MKIPRSNTIVPWGSGDELWVHPISAWTIRAEESSLEIISENMQKKMIPVKSLLPDYDEMLALNGDCTFSRKKSADSGSYLFFFKVLIIFVSRWTDCGCVVNRPSCEFRGSEQNMRSFRRIRINHKFAENPRRQTIPKSVSNC